jgi:peptidoglycan hydrolase CwlO-like protein
LSKKKFQKSVDSIRQQIELHYEKIAQEQQTLVPDKNLIFYWQREIAGLQKSLARAEKRLRRGK